MRVRITRTMTGAVDGIRLERFRRGQVYQVGPVLGNYLLASRGAEPVSDDTPAAVSPSSDRVLTLREYLDAASCGPGRERRMTSPMPHLRSMKHVQFIVAIDKLELVPQLRTRYRGIRRIDITPDRRRRERRRYRSRIGRDRRLGDRRVHDVTAELVSTGFAMIATA